MNVTILGSGTAIPHPRRASPGFVIEHEGLVLVDPSSGSLHRLARSGLDFRHIRSVIFSHYHPDHTGDLLPLLFACYIDQDAPQRLLLLGPPGLRRFVQGLVSLYGEWVGRLHSRLDIEEAEDWSGLVQGLSLSSLPVVHSEPALGYRWESPSGRTLAYSGDTEPCHNLVRLCSQADVALLEASYPRHLEAPGHLTGYSAGRAAAQAGVKRLLLCHRYPVCDQYDLLQEVREAGFEGECELAADGQRLNLLAT
ncbi:MAG TPA: MBL fold metallo-hydrolase [Acidobacteriota bacterium]|nr:MBL fold metallo-hydrolase [Acidobacteriota bacterium]